MAPFLLGVAGGTASGKTSVCEEIIRRLGQDGVAQAERRVALVGLDSFYRVLSPAESKAALAGDHNFDHPSTWPRAPSGGRVGLTTAEHTAAPHATAAQAPSTGTSS